MIARLLAIIAILFAATSAQAQVGWSAVGTACVPTGEDVTKYESVNQAGIQHSGNNVGSLAFTCSMDRFDSGTTAWVLRMTYRDSTGTLSTGSVVARSYRLGKTDKTPVLIAALSSNSSSVTGDNNILSGASFTHTFDFDANVYFVRVTLTRSSASQIVRLYSIMLEAK